MTTRFTTGTEESLRRDWWSNSFFFFCDACTFATCVEGKDIVYDFLGVADRLREKHQHCDGTLFMGLHAAGTDPLIEQARG